DLPWPLGLPLRGLSLPLICLSHRLCFSPCPFAQRYPQPPPGLYGRGGPALSNTTDAKTAGTSPAHRSAVVMINLPSRAARSQFRYKEPNYFVHTVTARLRQSPSPGVRG